MARTDRSPKPADRLEALALREAAHRLARVHGRGLDGAGRDYLRAKLEYLLGAGTPPHDHGLRRGDRAYLTGRAEKLTTRARELAGSLDPRALHEGADVIVVDFAERRRVG